MEKIEKLKEEFLSYFTENMNNYFDSESLLDKSCLYSLFAGGKRIRPILTMAMADISGGDRPISLALASAIEMIHTYSLIHDDLPAMDNDDYRRGKLTNHKVFGEDMAILAGDTLLTEAPLYILQEKNIQKIDTRLITRMILELMKASGKEGMIQGQVQDILNETSEHLDLSCKEKLAIIESTHNLKTGKLFALSCIQGLLSRTSINDVSESMIDKAAQFGMTLGLLFQIRDDILDVSKSFEELGKTPGKDEKSDKLTYVSLLGLQGSKDKAREHHNECLAIIDQFKIDYKTSHGDTLFEILFLLEKDVY